MEVSLLCAYAGLLVYAGHRSRTRENTATHFFVNNRAAGTWAVALSILVSCVGASATLGVAGLAFSVGTPAFWWLGAGAVGLTFLSALLARKVRASGAYTLPQMAETFLGRPARPLMSGIIVVAWMAILAAQFLALTRLLTAFVAMPDGLALALAWLLVVVHTLGGQAAVLRTDRWQSLLMFAGWLVLFAGLWRANPGWWTGARLEAVNDGYPAIKLWHALLIIGGNYRVCPMLFGRLLSARDETTARRAGFGAAGGLVLCSAGLVAAGLACRGLVPADTPADAVLTTALPMALPAWLAAFVTVALLGAVVSSADSCLVTAATVLSHDLLRRDDPATCRLAVAGLGLVGVALTFLGRDILGFLFMAYDIYMGGVVMPVFVGLLWQGKKSLRPAFACTAMAVGGALGGVAAWTENANISYVAVASSAIIALCGLRTSAPAGKRSAECQA